MTVIKVFLGGPRDADACTRYRQVMPAEQLQREGVDVEICTEVPGVVWRDDYEWNGQKDPRVMDWPDPECDVAIFQRPVRRDMADLIEIAAKKCTVIVDMDDDFFAIPQANKAWETMQPETSPKANLLHLRRALDAAHGITTTTDALQRRYGKAKTKIVPNYVPAAYLDIKPGEHAPNVAWTGTMQTHPYDLESTKGGVGWAMAGSGWEFHVVGDGAGVRDALELTADVVMTRTGWLPFDDYAEAMAQCSLGIVPLSTSAFNQGKSWLKGMEFAALGVPFVASNTQPYVALSKMGIGTIARGAKDWTAEIKRLMSSKGLREDIAWRNKDLVRQHLTIEGNAHRWLDAWLDITADRTVGALNVR